MRKNLPTPSSAKLDIAAITFVVFNGLAAALFVVIVNDTLNTTGWADQHKGFLVEHAGKLLGAIYAVGIGILILLRRAPGLWLSGAIASILTGCGFGFHLERWFLLPFLLPVGWWLILMIKRHREELARPSTEVESAADLPASRAGALVRMLPLVLGSTLKYLGAYLLGLLACVVYMVVAHGVSAAEFLRLGAWGQVIAATLPGLAAFFQILFMEFPSSVLHAWWAILVLLAPFTCEAMVSFRKKVSWRAWRPLWIGFPIGFLGSLGSTWMALASL